MRKIILLISLISPLVARAEDGGIILAGTYVPDIVARTIVVVLLFYVVAGFLLTLVRMLLDHRLKSKMINMGIVGTEAERLLRSNTEHKDYAIKWFFLLLSVGMGCILVNYYTSGWLSLGTLALSLSLGFAAYYLYLKKRKETL